MNRAERTQQQTVSLLPRQCLSGIGQICVSIKIDWFFDGYGPLFPSPVIVYNIMWINGRPFKVITNNWMAHYAKVGAPKSRRAEKHKGIMANNYNILVQ